MKLIKRDIPHFEGYYSLRSDGAVFSNDREVEHAVHGVMKVKGKQLSTAKYKNKHGTPSEANYRLRIGGKGYSVGLTFLKAITFPELYNLPVKSLDGEIWTNLYFDNDYLVSNLGRVKRKSKKLICCGVEWIRSDYLISTHIIHRNTPHPTVLFGCRRAKGVSKSLVLARCVYQSFLRLLSDDEVIHHNDGDFKNNQLSNLSIKKKNSGLLQYWGV